VTVRNKNTKSLVKVAVVQMLVQNSPTQNLRTILKYLEIASSQGSDIACFPEACLIHDEKRASAKMDASLFQELRSKCRELSIWCIFGSYAKEENGLIKNCAYLVDRHGKVVYRYSKAHLYRDELKMQHLVTGGRTMTSRVISTALGNLGVVICFDFAFPEYVKTLSRQGADIIFCPSFLVDCRGWEDMLRAIPTVRAFENTSYFVLCDAVTSDHKTAGMSFIAEPKKLIASSEKEVEGMLFAKLDLQYIRRLKTDFKMLRR